MAMAYLTFFTGIAISLVAIYYSVMGLTAIFAAAVVPIVIMGTILEVAKLVTTVWLKQNWKRSPFSLKAYLSVAVVVLMLITSMGIFGFLSKAHLDQGVPTGDVAAKVALLDEKIKTERDNIDTARKALAQMDASFEQTMSRSTSEQGADKAVSIRKSQAKERASLQKDIAVAQSNITKLNEERAPIASELRKVEAEVGPIKYIAALIYGDNPDANILEKAVTWVIITIIFVFDPLAVLLLLASQYSFVWAKEDKTEEKSKERWDQFFDADPIDFPEKETEIKESIEVTTQVDDEVNRAAEANVLLSEIEKEPETEVFEESSVGVVAQEVSNVLPEAISTVEEPKAQITIDQLNKVLDDVGLEVLDKTKKLTTVVEPPIIEEIEFPGNPFLGQQLTLTDRAYIYNGSTWVESPLNHQTEAEVVERPGDYVNNGSVTYVQNGEQDSQKIWGRLRSKSNDK